MTAAVMRVPFEGTTITLIEKDGVPYVAMRPICQNLGLAWSPQFRKLERDDTVRQRCLMATLPIDGVRQQETLFLAAYQLSGWLMTISPSKR